MLSPRKAAMWVRASSAHEAALSGTIHLDRNGLILREVKPCESWMGIAQEVKLHLALWRNQSPQAEPQHFWLNILTWFLINLSRLFIV